MVLAYDYLPPAGPERRQACRSEHLQLGENLYRERRCLYAAGILNEAGDLIGSLIICEFESRQQLEQEWLSREPYVLNNVWEKIEIRLIRPAPFLNSRPAN